MSRFHSRRSFLKTLGAAALAAPFVTRGLMASSPNSRLAHACFGAGGMAWSDMKALGNCSGVEIVAICDVDLRRTDDARRRFPNARIYQDWRELLDKEKDIDSVNVSTPDHMHAPIAVSAMQLGKHVYAQKPLAHDVHEVRRMTEIAREKKVVTQTGIQIHSAPQYRSAVQALRDGVIGKVREVHSWCPKSWGDPSPRPDTSSPVPDGFDWDLWLGVCAERPFIGNGYYHPAAWRKRLDFGTGTLGDMGCHLFDPVFTALDLTAPRSVRSEGPPPNAWNWAIDSKVHYQFAGTERTAAKALPVTWYDGSSKPPAAIVELLEGDLLPNAGSIFVGSDGVMSLPHVDGATLYPRAKFRGFSLPDVGGIDHYAQFVSACWGEGKTTAGFAHGGPLTESILLGGIASKFPDTSLEWSAPEMAFNSAAANRFLRRNYREGWKVKGLS